MSPGLQVVSIRARNQSYRLSVQGGASLFAKLGYDADRAATVAREAALYRLLLQARTDVPLAPFRGYDPVLHLLGVGWVEGRTLEDALRRGGPRAGAGRALGRALVALHQVPPSAAAEALGVNNPGSAPWILSSHRPSLSRVQDVSPAQAQGLALLQKYSAFEELLDRLCRSWSPEALIHNDLRSSNILLARGCPTLIDWELGGPGDPRWDMGSVIGEVLTTWVRALPLSPEGGLDELLARPRHRIQRFHPFLRAFVEGYAGGLPRDADRRGWLDAVVGFAAARMILLVLEHATLAPLLPASSYYLLQLALNLSRQPREAAHSFLGLSGFP
ncbi:MAG: phosphotransferase [Acidobacteriota bacterium]